MAETQRDKELKIYQDSLDKSIKLEALQSQSDYVVIRETIEGLMAEFSSVILNGDPADHDTYLVNRAKLDGVRAVQARLDTIIKNGKQAADAINTISG